MSALSSSLSLTLETHRLAFEVRPGDRGLDHLSCTFDGRIVWEADTASWRALSVLASSARIVFWSARHLVRVAPDGSVEVLESGDDIVAVLPSGTTLIVLGESSLRMHRDGDLALLDRVELSDVVTDWEIDGSRLDLRLLDGKALRFDLGFDQIGLSPHNQRFVKMLHEAIAGFAAGDLELGQVQSVFHSVLGLLEGDQMNVARLIRNAEGDIEEIRFGKPLEEQRAAAMARLDRLQGDLSRDTEG